MQDTPDSLVNDCLVPAPPVCHLVMLVEFPTSQNCDPWPRHSKRQAPQPHLTQMFSGLSSWGRLFPCLEDGVGFSESRKEKELTWNIPENRNMPGALPCPWHPLCPAPSLQTPSKDTPFHSFRNRGQRGQWLVLKGGLEKLPLHPAGQVP